MLYLKISSSIRWLSVNHFSFQNHNLYILCFISVGLFSRSIKPPSCLWSRSALLLLSSITENIFTKRLKAAKLLKKHKHFLSSYKNTLIPSFIFFHFGSNKTKHKKFYFPVNSAKLSTGFRVFFLLGSIQFQWLVIYFSCFQHNVPNCTATFFQSLHIVFRSRWLP